MPTWVASAKNGFADVAVGSFLFAAAFGRVGLGVHEAHAEHGAGSGQPGVGERRAVVGVEDDGHAAAHDRARRSSSWPARAFSWAKNRPSTIRREWSSTIRNSRARTEASTRGHGTHGPTSTSVIHRSFGASAS